MLDKLSNKTKIFIGLALYTLMWFIVLYFFRDFIANLAVPILIVSLLTIVIGSLIIGVRLLMHRQLKVVVFGHIILASIFLMMLIIKYGSSAVPDSLETFMGVEALFTIGSIAFAITAFVYEKNHITEMRRSILALSILSSGMFIFAGFTSTINEIFPIDGVFGTGLLFFKLILIILGSMDLVLASTYIGVHQLLKDGNTLNESDRKRSKQKRN